MLFTFLFFLIFRLAYQKQSSKYEDRIKKYIPREQEQITVKVQSKTKNIRFEKRLIESLAKRFQGRAFLKKWERNLEEAGLPLKPEEFFVLRLIMVIPAFMFFLILGFEGAALVIASFSGFMLPTLYLKRKKRLRLERCATQLPQTLSTTATSLKAGFSFMQAMQVIGKEIPDPIGPEFKRTLKEMNYGVPVEEALENLLKRVPNADLEMVITALLVQRTTGGNLADILETMKETIEERVKIKEELKALTSQGKLSAIVITLLPVILAVILNFMNPQFFEPMFSHPLGLAFLFVGGVLITIGWVMIQKIVNVEV